MLTSLMKPDGHGRIRHNAYPRDPQKAHAYLIGGGIASLSAAVVLLHEARVPASQIHILESSSILGGSMDAAGTPETGYSMRGGRMLNFSYLCLYDLLRTIPSLTDNKKSVLEEIEEFNDAKGNKTHDNARLVRHHKHADGRESAQFEDGKSFGLSGGDRLKLAKVMLQTEGSLGEKKIEDCFDETFFKSNFWFMWATMFAFQQWHSAKEFHRYLHRFIQELPRINTLEGVDRTPYNQYDSIILPIITYLKKEGVEFKYNTKVVNVSYTDKTNTTVEDLHIIENGMTGVVHIHSTDIVIITLGSMTTGSVLGTNTTPPAPLPISKPDTAPDSLDGSWALWHRLSLENPKFGNPLKFCTRIQESTWESFTVTLKSPEFLKHMTEWTKNEPGTGALMTLKDSAWLMSIVIPHQPHFINQPKDVQVFWGYGLFPDKVGDYVKKPMYECSGEEIFSELLQHLQVPLEPTLKDAITIPCVMPYITSQFLTRGPGDRPKVIPEGSKNLAFVGQFVEMPLDTVFTVEYSVRGAEMAVYGLMGIDKEPRPVYKGEHDVTVLARTLMAMVENHVPSEEEGWVHSFVKWT